MVNQEDRPFTLGTNLYPYLERLPAPGFDPEVKRGLFLHCYRDRLEIFSITTLALLR